MKFISISWHRPRFQFLKPLRLALVLMLALAFSPGSFAEAGAKSDVAVHLTAKRVVVVSNKESLEAAERAKPGDTIQYEAVYHNASKAGVNNLEATIPVPQGLALLDNSATPAGALASLDGKNFEPMPLMREVKKPDGTTEKQQVPLGEYRALRWSISELAADQSTSVALRARVLSSATTK